MTRLPHSAVASAALLLLAALALPSCQSDVDERVALAGLSSGCRINSDCGELLACVFERCHQECSSSRDCERGARCMRTEQGRNVCQLPDESACSDLQGCPGQQVCGPDAECRDGCRSDDECVAEQVCSRATCADATELGPDGALAPAAEPPTVPAPCGFDSDCPLPLVCVAGSCQPPCALDADCRPGQRCEAAACVAVTTPGACLRNSDCDVGDVCRDGRCQAEPSSPECDYDSDCGTDGQRCAAGVCRCECATDDDCGATEACARGCQCVPNRVIEGDVTVSNERELAAFADVVEITGQLTVDSYRYGFLRFPYLRKAHRVVASGQNTTIVFDALEQVDGAFLCSQDCRASALRTVGELSYTTQAPGELTLPALETAGSVSFKDSSNITALRLPRLTTATDFVLQNLPALVTVEAPKLATLASINVSATKRLRHLSLPLAQPTMNLYLTSNQGLETVSLPRVRSLNNKLYVFESYQLRALDLRHLESVNEIEFRGVLGLTDLNLDRLERVPGTAQFAHIVAPLELSLPGLQSAGAFIFTASSQALSFSAPNVTELGSLELSGLHGLQALDLEKLAKIGALYVTATGLRDLDKLDQSRAGSLAVATGNITIVGNSSLPSCVVQSLQLSLGTNIGGNFVNQTNCDCPGSFCP